MSEWADRYRKLSSESSAEPGQWFTNRAAYQRGIMDVGSDRSIRTVVVETGSQVGKTEIALNVIGYHIHQDPAPILVLQPTLDMGETFSKDRLAPMLRDTPALKGKVADPKSRDSGNTLLAKSYPGGTLAIAGANSAASLASRPIRILLCDEIDRYPLSAGTEGDPVSLAKRRTATFWNSKTWLFSTPGTKGLSRIDAEWDLSDQRRYFVPCPHCGHEQHLAWRQVRWPEGKPRSARYFCEGCGAEWSENERRAAVRWGKWKATAAGNGETAGFHLNEIYSPWVHLGDMARGFLEAKRSPETLKTWVNTSLGESYEEDAERVDAHALSAPDRLEAWGDTAPAGVLAITCGVDIQDDRIEVERVGWGVEEESWSLDHRIFYGDPSAPDVWRELDEYLLTRTTRCDGTALPVHCAAVDTGGHQTQAVYRFVASRFRRRVYGIKGMAGPGRPVWPKRASKVAKGKVNLFIIGVDSAKDAIYARLKIQTAGPGHCHFPIGRDQAWFEQLTSEIVHTRFVKGFPTRVYVLPAGRRNEALDCRTYSYAALQALNIRWGRLLAERRAILPPQPAAETAKPPPMPVVMDPPRPVQRFASRRRIVRSNWV